RSHQSHAGTYALTALGLACLLSIAAAVTANPLADAFIFLSVAGLCTFSVLSMTTPVEEIGPHALARAPLDVCRLLLAEAAARIGDTFAALRMRAAIPLVRAGTMACALAAILFLLLSAADPAMADWRDVACHAILSWTFLARDVFFVVSAVLLLGAYGLAARRSQPAAGSRDTAVRRAPASTVRFSDLERLIVLGAALALFAVFFAAELLAQLASPAFHLPAGETFAEATHRGFGEMIVAAALCAMVIITLDQRALRNGREASVRLVAWAVVVASLLAVAAAYQRVRYYEFAYGYTALRLYVQICCAAVSIVLLLLAWELRSVINVPRLMRHVALVGVASVAGLSYWNSSAWIVGANVARYQSSGKLDVDYLGRLARSSPDAIPALIDALPRLGSPDAQRLRDSLAHASIAPPVLLPPGRTVTLSWYEWSLRRAAVRTALRKAGMIAAAASH
ncbi:MAG: DUF4173 domain-containing protein, partial [Gammaproteobacteria bacterium]|nr:DUF4173 domain-containing protein [Gammaproteobacteria bacterium]